MHTLFQIILHACINTTPIPFTLVGPDQAQEYVNKVHKGDGAISGITTSPDALLKYCLSSPELHRLASETEKLLNISHTGIQKHHSNTSAKIGRQEKAAKQLKGVLAQSNPFLVSELDDASQLKLFNLTTKMIMPEAVKNDILDMEVRGNNALTEFVEQRIVGDKNL